VVTKIFYNGTKYEKLTLTALSELELENARRQYEDMYDCILTEVPGESSRHNQETANNHR
jgi:hypothetical protein